MAQRLKSARIVSDARERAGLSQRELARRARTAQSVVARIELGETSPSVDTLTRILRATGFEARVELEPIGVVDKDELADVPRILRLSPEDRLREVGNLSRFLAAVRRK